MSSDSIDIGDTVYFKAGDDDLRVISINGDRATVVHYDDGTKREITIDGLPISSLVKVDSSNGPKVDVRVLPE